MILLTSAKMPDGLDKDTLANAVWLMFPNPRNQKYFNEIRCRTNVQAACESLFALAMLYDKITELPCASIDTSDLIFSRSEVGKPYFENSEIKFNVSHSKGYVACAVSMGEELGVDIEASEISPERAEKLAKRYFGTLDQQDIASSPEVFARKWTEKEAKAKFFGKSIGNILSTDKKSCDNQVFDEIIIHRFRFDNIPISLCTKRQFSTITFTIQ